MSFLKKIFSSSIVEPVAKVFEKREARKAAKVSGEAKLALAKQSGEQQVTLTDAEWEEVSVSNQNTTWKDEYITVVITSPIIGILVGAILLAFTGDDRLLEGVNHGITALKATGVDMGELMYIVVLAAVGLKAWRSR